MAELLRMHFLLHLCLVLKEKDAGSEGMNI